MPSTEPAILRALEGLADRTGRTVLILGPPLSGKSATLERLRYGVEAVGGRTILVKGTYRGRSVPFSGLEALDRVVEPPGNGALGDATGPSDTEGGAPMAPVAIAPEALGPSRRRDGRPRTSFLGEPTRTRGPPPRDPSDFWERVLPELRDKDARPVALLVEEAALFDGESREFVLDLSRRARLRPFLIAVTLDSTASAAGVWEEALLGRTDVDWIRLGPSAADAREIARLGELLNDLPAPAKRLLGQLTLLGGEATAVVLARISQLGLGPTQEALRPAVRAGLVRIREGKVTVSDPGAVPVLESLIPDDDRRRWHHDVAEGLQALSAEPPLARRVEIAHHYLASAPDAVAMARLLEGAEANLGLVQYDEASRLLSEAIGCLPSVPPADRVAVEPEIHLLNARSLFGSGCLPDAETALREGIEGALRAGVEAADLASWLEPLLPALLAVGPRSGLSATIDELVQRLHAAGLLEPEVLLETLLPAYDLDRQFTDRSRQEALRAAQNARRLHERHLQALGLFVMGVSRLTGSAKEVAQAERFLRAARHLLKDSRRWELEYMVGEFECRVLERQGKLDQALALRRQSALSLERARLPSVELFHLLGVARILLDRGETPPAERPLARARRLADILHLVPPAPGLLELWLLEGRVVAASGQIEAARERFSALVDLPVPLSLPRYRAEATLRLALLEQSVGRTELARQLADRLEEPELSAGLTEAARAWAKDLAGRAPSSQHGGAPLTLAPRPGAAAGLERGEQRGR